VANECQLQYDAMCGSMLAVEPGQHGVGPIIVYCLGLTLTVTIWQRFAD
jgi:hypothetical protein